ncbi:MAG: tripartite tricarboxylate transporter substrate binding protein, partial [Nitrosospira sp.]|nr:tripartite tricarboxylate transporter substrate binding protein [Nitrosospira sp.]
MPDHPDSATIEEALVLPLILPKGTDPAVVSSLHDALDRAIAMTLSADQAQMLERADRMAELLTGLFVPND